MSESSRNADPGGISRQITKHYAKNNYSGADSNTVHQIDEIMRALPKPKPPNPEMRSQAAALHRKSLKEALAAMIEVERALRAAGDAARVARIEDWTSGYLAVQLEQAREKIAAQLRKTA
jgi:hypothetical protein